MAFISSTCSLKAEMDNPRRAAATFYKKASFARHLSDKLLIEFNQACNNNRPELALRFLDTFESTIRTQSLPKSVERNQLVGLLVVARERLWGITHPAELSPGKLRALPPTKSDTIH
jgi:hypothetical protein